MAWTGPQRGMRGIRGVMRGSPVLLLHTRLVRSVDWLFWLCRLCCFSCSGLGEGAVIVLLPLEGETGNTRETPGGTVLWNVGWGCLPAYLRDSLHQNPDRGHHSIVNHNTGTIAQRVELAVYYPLQSLGERQIKREGYEEQERGEREGERGLEISLSDLISLSPLQAKGLDRLLCGIRVFLLNVLPKHCTGCLVTSVHPWGQSD